VVAQEIERKFLLASDAWRDEVVASRDMRQGYLGGDGVSVRIRIAGDEAWLNVKEMRLGASRREFEYAVPLADALELMALSREGRIEKTRHYVPMDGLTWEIDEFRGANAGLLVAEIELEREGQDFSYPAWLGVEVTEQERYYNVALARHPYSTWSDA
jgi:adenylate cyclase